MQNAIGLPTQTVYAIFGKLSMELTHPQRNTLGKIYQRACLVGPYEDAVQILQVHLDDDLTDGDKDKLKLVHTLAKAEVLGVTMEVLTEITQSPMSAQKDKVLATQALNEIYGESDKMKDAGFTDKLILNLVGKG